MPRRAGGLRPLHAPPPHSPRNWRTVALASAGAAAHLMGVRRPRHLTRLSRYRLSRMRRACSLSGRVAVVPLFSPAGFLAGARLVAVLAPPFLPAAGVGEWGFNPSRVGLGGEEAAGTGAPASPATGGQAASQPAGLDGRGLAGGFLGGGAPAPRLVAALLACGRRTRREGGGDQAGMRQQGWARPDL